MKRIALAAVLLLPAAVASSTNKSFIRTHDVQPCQWWQYDSGANGYICQSTGMRISVPDGYDTQQAISDLERQVQALEDRVRRLEQGQ